MSSSLSSSISPFFNPATHRENNHGKKRRTNLDQEQEDDGQGQGQQKTRILNLPFEIIHDILSRLPISSLVQFKYVSRASRSLAQDPNLVKLYFSSTKENNPCLIFHCDFPIRNQLYFVDFAATNKKVKRINLPFWPEMPEFHLVGSCNGLLCLSDSLYNAAIYIYNPFNTNYLELPKSPNFLDQYVVFGFGFHLQNYKVVKIIYYRNGRTGAQRLVYPQSEVQILTLGTSQWRSLGKISYQLLHRPSEALVNGKLHWVSRPQRNNVSPRIISLDLGHERFQEVPKPDRGSLSRCNFHLLVLKGWLSAGVYCNYRRVEIWVMKEHNVKESWGKLYSIGSYILPKAVKQNLDAGLFKNLLNGRRVVRVLGILKNSKILLEYKSRVLVTYDPNNGHFKDLTLQGIPKWFQTVVHLGSLNWIN
ncbi:F-box and associated interaction domains-containing protein [Euphorbia peplus]|nr:F-box and associated interaction domains-containing protein [Euphorbia peplus]